MINIPLDYLPVKLLVMEGLSPQIKAMLTRCQGALARRRWALAERYAANAKEASQRVSGRPVDYALALLHLADVYRSSLRPGLALDYSQEAQLTLDKQPGPKHYHNRAAANYGLGLTHHVLGSDAKASEWYGRARALFERAMRYWAWESNPGRQAQCEEAIRWIEALIQNLEEWVDLLHEEPLCASVWIPIFRYEGETPQLRLLCLPATLRGQIEGIRIGEQTYQLLQLNAGSSGERLTIDFRVPHFAVEIGSDGASNWIGMSPEEETAGQPIPQPGDLVLIRGRCLGNRETLRGVEVSSADFQGGRFVRGDQGFRFILERGHIIGGRGETIGKVVALLRPVQR